MKHMDRLSQYAALAAVLAGLTGCFHDPVTDNQTCSGLQSLWLRDADADGYSDGMGLCARERPGADYRAPDELAGLALDCDDADPAVHPLAQELCGDGPDNDCDGIADCSYPAPSLWQPAPGTSWQWQLTGQIDRSFNVAMYDIDLFDSPQSLIDQLHAEGRIVVCYFSAGSWENWRPDADMFPASVKGAVLQGWPDERWLDIRRLDILGPLLETRLDMAAAKGCDGVEPDNVDAYSNRSGFPLTSYDQLRFNVWLARQAHARGLSVGLKNDLEQIPQLLYYFDWALNEQCFLYGECEALVPFVEAGKAVFGVEYELKPEEFCPEANAMNFDWLKKSYDLDASRQSCR